MCLSWRRSVCTTKRLPSGFSISLATVKTHLKHIYGRLDVPNRRQAVIKAEELGVLGKG